ncbi:hypothetical protein ACYSNR_14350 [Enterococcus sp. LJL128]
MYQLIEFDSEAEKITDFLSLPKKIYTSAQLTQDMEEEQALLSGTHLLSSYFRLRKLLVYDKQGNVCGRCVLTIYPNDHTGYLGFFETTEDKSCSRLLFDWAAETAAAEGLKKLVGPVDCSFWVRYRLKTSHFERAPYITEPYHHAYYLDYFLENQFEITETYVSNSYPAMMKDQQPSSYLRVHQRLIKQGYQIVSPRKQEWEQVIGEVYQLLIELYADFPVFKEISQEDFQTYFARYKIILDLSMVKMAYYKGQPVAFFIGIPDYGNSLYGRMTPVKLFRFLRTKKKAKRYILSYLGVLNSHLGVGLGIAHEIMEELYRRGAASVGAFIQSGKVTERYWGEFIEDKSQYVLLERKVQ